MALKVEAQDTLRAELNEEKSKNEKKSKDEGAKVTITNKADEPPFGLKLFPTYLVFKYLHPSPAFDTITITNILTVKQAFKMKTNENKSYSFRPSVGFLAPGEKVAIRITYLNHKDRQGPPNEMIHVAAYHTASGSAKSNKEAFGNGKKKPDGVHHFYCTHRVDFAGEVGEEQQ
ncbi:unnamed protein product [Caenorhabditis sp. 36 PRJEB53466]|nr:unnamed protein product [Caenorhabditis sp. 36 PRJEB53466]